MKWRSKWNHTLIRWIFHEYNYERCWSVLPIKRGKIESKTLNGWEYSIRYGLHLPPNSHAQNLIWSLCSNWFKCSVLHELSWFTWLVRDVIFIEQIGHSIIFGIAWCECSTFSLRYLSLSWPFKRSIKKIIVALQTIGNLFNQWLISFLNAFIIDVNTISESNYVH